ncbi:hypothetical protein JOC78_000492 [Bacillus ectoiniformans]|nr:hypothetical protein [Bacillus ectoiniformans]
MTVFFSLVWIGLLSLFIAAVQIASKQINKTVPPADSEE